MTYQNEDATEFLNSQGWTFKQSGEELIAKCPLCEKEDHFYIHAQKGVWKCHHCGEAGNLYQLRQRLGLPPYKNGNGLPGIKSFRQAIGSNSFKRISKERIEEMHTALLADKEALEYCLKERKWTPDIIKAMKIGVQEDSKGKWIAYPYWRKGQCLLIKYRILPKYQDRYPGRFKRESGCESILFNEDALSTHDEIILASGESDCISAMVLGAANVVGIPTGESSLPPSAVDALSAKKKVIIVYDNDEAGKRGAKDVAKRIGYDHSYLAKLPDEVHDINEFLVKVEDQHQFNRLISEATRFDVPSIYDIRQALDRLEEQKTTANFDQAQDVTPWHSVNRILGEWGAGNLIVVSGPQGTGKTTFCLNFAFHWAFKCFPSLIYCLEMNLSELVQHVLCAHYMKTEQEIDPGLISQAKEDMAQLPLYLGVNHQISRIKDVIEILEQAVRRFGLKLVVFDNLHMLARSIDHRTEEIGNITKSFKSLAMKLEIPIVLIAQPRKLEPGRVMTPYDLKDSSDIFSDADQIILLHREHVGAKSDSEAIKAGDSEESDNYDPHTLVRLAKARHKPSKDTVLYFEGAQHRFREIQELQIQESEDEYF